MVDVAGETLSTSAAFLRAVFKFLPWEIAHGALWNTPGWPGRIDAMPPGVLLAMGMSWLLAGWYVIGMFVAAEHRTPYDRAASSIVALNTRVGGVRPSGRAL